MIQNSIEFTSDKKTNKFKMEVTPEDSQLVFNFNTTLQMNCSPPACRIPLMYENRLDTLLGTCSVTRNIESPMHVHV